MSQPIKSAIKIAQLLDCEGFTDHTANELERYWKTVTRLTQRQRSQLARLETAITEWCHDMPEEKRLLMGRFIGLHKKMSFEVGLRMGLASTAIKGAAMYDGMEAEYQALVERAESDRNEMARTVAALRQELELAAKTQAEREVAP